MREVGKAGFKRDIGDPAAVLARVVQERGGTLLALLQHMLREASPGLREASMRPFI